MNILQLVKDGLALIQELEPGLTAAVKAGSALGMMGSAVVKIVQKGQRLITYVISRREGGETIETPPRDIVPIADDEPMVTKPDVAVVVDVSRRILRDVARYLDDHDIDADIILLTNDPQYRDVPEFMNAEDQDAWVEVVQDFHRGTSRIKREVGAARVHIFLGTPLPLAYGMGAVWGTVDNATVYHWEGNTYHPVMPISRALRSK